MTLSFKQILQESIAEFSRLQSGLQIVLTSHHDIKISFPLGHRLGSNLHARTSFEELYANYKSPVPLQEYYAAVIKPEAYILAHRLSDIFGGAVELSWYQIFKTITHSKSVQVEFSANGLNEKLKDIINKVAENIEAIREAINEYDRECPRCHKANGKKGWRNGVVDGFKKVKAEAALGS